MCLQGGAYFCITQSELKNLSKNELLEIIFQRDFELDKLTSENDRLSSESSLIESKTKGFKNEVNLLEANAKNLESRNGHLESKNGYLEGLVRRLHRILFGVSSERFISIEYPNQLRLPFDIPEDTAPEKQEETSTYVERKKKKKVHPGRVKLPKDLPVEEIVIEPEEDTTGMKFLRNEITEKLEYKPAQLYIKRYIRPIYIKDDSENETSKGVIGGLPEFAINKGIAGASLLAQIMVDKFADHLPIYRQIERFERSDITCPHQPLTVGKKVFAIYFNRFIKNLCVMWFHQDIFKPTKPR